MAAIPEMVAATASAQGISPFTSVFLDGKADIIAEVRAKNAHQPTRNASKRNKIAIGWDLIEAGLA